MSQPLKDKSAKNGLALDKAVRSIRINLEDWTAKGRTGSITVQIHMTQGAVAQCKMLTDTQI